VVGNNGTKIPMTPNASEIDPNMISSVFIEANVCKKYEKPQAGVAGNKITSFYVNIYVPK